MKNGLHSGPHTSPEGEGFQKKAQNGGMSVTRPLPGRTVTHSRLDSFVGG